MDSDYVIIIEKADGNYSAYCPDLPGVVAVGDTQEECETEMRDAIAFHLEGMREENLPIPQPSAVSRVVHVEFAA